MEGLPTFDRATEIGQELLRGISDKSFGIAAELAQSGHSPDYWAGVASWWAGHLNAHAYHAAAVVAEPLRDTAWLTEAVDKACSAAGLTPERRLMLEGVVSPYASQAYGFALPLGTGVLDSVALLLEATPWWVLWLALFVSLPGSDRRRSPTPAANGVTKARGACGVLGTLAAVLAGGAAAAAAAVLHLQPASLELTVQEKSALLTLALCVGMIAWILVVVGAVPVCQKAWLRVPVAAVLPMGLAWHFLMPEAAFCAARSQQCRPVLPEDIIVARDRHARNQQLQAGPHEHLAATVNVLARTKPRGSGPVSRATVLAVGSHELKEDLADFAAFGALNPQMIFVEPNSKHIPGLRRSLDMIDAPAKYTKIITAAACEVDKKNVTLYTSAQAATRDSLDRHYVSRHSDMKQKKVKCMSMPSVLAAAEAVASDVDVVVLDAEGSDFKILDALLRLPRFVPLLVRFPCCFGWEARGIPDELVHKMTDLAERGYDVYLDGDDVLAVHESVKDAS